ncbi:MAG: hypothetical protein QG626_137 [Patescibacteria group bacterium]|nr:hypothetical protein [Patescibacteria group bacterium]
MELVLVALFDDPEGVIPRLRSGVGTRHERHSAVALTVQPGHERFVFPISPLELQTHGLEVGGENRRNVRVLLGLESPSTALRDETSPHLAGDHAKKFAMKPRGQINDIAVSQGTPPELRLA